MKYKEFDVAGKKESSDGVANLLKSAGLRCKQLVVKESGQRILYKIVVHTDDLQQAGQLLMEDDQRKRVEFVKSLRFVLQPFFDKDMLMDVEPNEAGYFGSIVYHGEAFDESKFRVIRGGWDHEHCYVCSAKVLPGDEWWVTHPANFEDDIGLCLDCYAKLHCDADSTT